MIFERGYYIDSTVSAYKDYPSKDYTQLAEDIIRLAQLPPGCAVLDFGCAVGLLVDSMFKKGIDIVGTDISYWAINYGRERLSLPKKVLQHYNRQLLEDPFDFTLFLDVLEHIPEKEIEEILSLVEAPFLIVRIPVSEIEGGDFIIEIHRKDSTHIQCHSKEWWEAFFDKYDYITHDILQGEAIYESPEMLCRVLVRK